LLRHRILYRVQAAFLALACAVFGDGSNIDLLDKRQPLNKYPYADLANRRDKALADGEVMKRGAFPQKGVGGAVPASLEHASLISSVIYKLNEFGWERGTAI
jgi:hypothetical protein